MTKKILSFFVSIMLLCIAVMPISVYAAPEFQISNGTLTKYNGTAETVYIPDTVKRIGGSAFYNNKYIKNVILSDKTVTINAGGCMVLFKAAATLKVLHSEKGL